MTIKFEDNKFESTCPKLKLFGEEYILVNDDGNKIEGAIATQEQYDNFELNYAHLNNDGTITRFGEIIGNINDIKWID